MATTPNIQLQSNSIRGEFKDAIVDKTIQEIHDVITTVFGPYATDAYALKDTASYNKTYYTRDGKEVLRSLSFNNALANYVLSILNQAVDRQGSKIGDGTTTLAVLYTNLYKILRRTGLNQKYSMNTIRAAWGKVIDKMNSLLESIATHDITPDMLASMIYTCTQDTQLTKMFVDQVANKVVSGAYVTVNRSDSDTELEVVVNDKPLIKAELLSSMYRVEDFGSNCVPLFVNGNLDIGHEETLQVLCEAVFANTPRNYVFICSGTTQATRTTLQSYMAKRNAYAKMVGKDPKDITNNIIIMKKGVIDQVGDPHTVYYHPVDEFVADFIGESNFLRGKLAEKDGESGLATIEGHKVEVAHVGHLAVGDDAVLVLRPEAAKLADEGVLPCKVTLSRFMGNYQNYQVMVGDTLVKITDFNPKNHKIYEVGDEAYVQFTPEDVHVL